MKRFRSALPSAADQRSSYRIPVLADEQDAVIELSGRRLNGLVVEQSATGLKVSLPGRVQLKRGVTVSVYHDEVWASAELIHAAIENGQTILGLKRMESFVPMPRTGGRRKALRAMLPGNALSAIVTGLLTALIAAVLFTYAPSTTRPDYRRPHSYRPAPTSHVVKAPRKTTGFPSSGITLPDFNRVIRERFGFLTKAKSHPAQANPAPSAATPIAATAAIKTAQAEVPAEMALVEDEKLRDELQITPEQRVRLEDIRNRTPTPELAEALLKSLNEDQRRLWTSKTMRAPTESGVVHSKEE